MSKAKVALTFKGFRPSSERAQRAMTGNRAVDTRPELVLRGQLWRLGLRFRKNVARLPGTPDIVFPRHKVAVFCDGDFWHGKDWAKRRRKLQRGSNRQYWIGKIRSNIDRDARVSAELKRSGWHVVRFWESDIRQDSVKAAVKIAKILRKARFCRKVQGSRL
jgi:DNA mismatch endonuclease, patch repair protein